MQKSDKLLAATLASRLGRYLNRFPIIRTLPLTSREDHQFLQVRQTVSGLTLPAIFVAFPSTPDNVNSVAPDGVVPLTNRPTNLIQA